MKRVEVTWHDAFGLGPQWVSADGLNLGPCVVRSVGLLVKPGNKGHITLAQTVNHRAGREPDYFHVFYIPLGMVKKVRRL